MVGWIKTFKGLICAQALLVGVTLSSGVHATDPYAHCDKGHPFKSEGAYAALARGFNLPNWSPHYQGWKPDDGLLKLLKRQGFSHIRLPVDAENLMARYHDGDHIAAYLDHLSETVTRLVGLGYSVSIDMHPEGRFQRLHENKSDEAYPLLLEAWDRISQRSTKWPKASVFFELLNEPTPSQDIWWQQAQKLVTHLNDHAKGRGLIIGPAVFQRHEILAEAEPLKGNNLIYAIHYYDPMVFTHQAMTWAEGSTLARMRQLPFPGSLDHPAVQAQIKRFEAEEYQEGIKDIKNAYVEPWNAGQIKAALEPVARWSTRHNVPVIINEFGVLDFDVDRWARSDWLKAVRQAAESHCLGWTHWDFSDGFAMVDPETTLPDPLVLDALTTPAQP